MKKISLALLAQAVANYRKKKNMTQSDLSVASGINRSILSRIETHDYTPSVDMRHDLQARYPEHAKSFIIGFAE